jgi:sphinganine-1-phosphate aldolase
MSQDSLELTSPRGSIIPDTAHAAFDKGASYLQVKVHVIPVHFLTRRVDIKKLKRAM